jgi:ABC-type multidrug transport system fused ATPase/permease subunit
VDKIVVQKNARNMEEGGCDELMHAEGLYRRMWDEQ